MKVRIAALAAALTIFSFTSASSSAPLEEKTYRSISPEEMTALLESIHAVVHKEQQHDGYPILLVQTEFGNLEIRFAACHIEDHPERNPCGYTLIKRYRRLALTTAQINSFNEMAGFGYAFRPAHSRDVLLAYPVAVRDGIGGAYILSTVGLLLVGLTDVFEGHLTYAQHIKAERIHTE